MIKQQVLIEVTREFRDDDFSFVTFIYGNINEAAIKQAIDDYRDESPDESIWEEIKNYGRYKYTIIPQLIK